ncbi:MAG: inner membrane protein YpjD [Myxococcales bacterium]
MTRGLLSAACHIYAVSTALYLFYLVRARAGVALAGLVTLLVGFALHAAVIVLNFKEYGYTPAHGLAEGLSFCAWLLVLGFVIVERRYRVPIVGVFVTPVALTLVLPALLFDPSAGAMLPAALQHSGLRVHITIAFAGIASFGLATGVAAMYLLLERQMKGKRFGMLFSRLPSLDRLDTINNVLVRWGFVALSITLISGAFFAKQIWGRYWTWDPKQVLTLTAWMVYAALIQARFFVGWRGRRVALLTMVGFAILFGSFVGLKAFPISMHAGEFQ